LDKSAISDVLTTAPTATHICAEAEVLNTYAAKAIKACYYIDSCIVISVCIYACMSCHIILIYVAALLTNKDEYIQSSNA